MYVLKGGLGGYCWFTELQAALEELTALALRWRVQGANVECVASDYSLWDIKPQDGPHFYISVDFVGEE